MAELYGVYKCNVCGNVVRVNLAGGGNLFCCGQPMVLQRPKDSGEGEQKHLPVVERAAEGLKVTVGEVPHVMEQNHWIVWVEVETADGYCYQRFLKPGEEPVVEFRLSSGEEPKVVREYCNLHGLWERKL